MNLKINIRVFSLMVLCTLFTALGQLLWKYSTNSMVGHLIDNLLNLYLILGIISYCIGFIFLLLAMKYAELSVVFPMVGLGYLWVVIAAVLLFHESVSIYNWIGVIVIVFGVTLVGVSSK